MSAFWSDVRAGFRDIAPPLIAGAPIGLLFGAIAVSKGLSAAEVALMSATLFAGGAQFAAIEQWTMPAAIGVLTFGTLLINARHILMGASLTPKTRTFRPWQRFLGFFAMADENWAFCERRSFFTELRPAYYFSMAIPFYLNWVAWSTLGALLGPLMGDPARFGADFAFTALFIGLIAGFWRGLGSAAVLLASAGAAVLAKLVVGAPWHVPAGAFAGILAAYLIAPGERAA